MNKNQIGKWVRWLLFSEGLILLLALAGPGRRSGRRRIDNALLARLFWDDPSYVEAVVVNFIAINLFVVSLFLVALVVTRLRK